MNDFSNLDALLKKFVDDGLPGCSCIVSKKGETLFEGYYGMADIENNVPLGPEHVFRQASLTKVALYTVVMMLYEQGRFLMTDPCTSTSPSGATPPRWSSRPTERRCASPWNTPSP